MQAPSAPRRPWDHLDAGLDADWLWKDWQDALDLDLVEGVLPVLPEPVGVETGIEVVPREHLGALALTRRVPGDVHGLVGERLLGGGHPPAEAEVLAPPVEPAAVLPDRPDHPADPPVAARQ